jgi:small subunit ribosomal protein S2
VGTKKQAQEIMVAEANRCGMFYVNQRWLGGTLTNWQTIKGRIDQLNRLEEREARGEFSRLPKKEGLKLQDELHRLRKYLSGLQFMRTPPTAVFLVDLEKERIAVEETIKMRLPTVALVDTNCNPRIIDHPIPGNDDAIRSIKLIVGRIADAVIDGQARRKASLEEDAKRLAEELAATAIGDFSQEGSVVGRVNESPLETEIKVEPVKAVVDEVEYGSDSVAPTEIRVEASEERASQESLHSGTFAETDEHPESTIKEEPSKDS